MKVKTVLCSFTLMIVTALSCLAQAVSPSPTPPSKTVQLAFGDFNDFPKKGIPKASVIPSESLDMAAVLMARQITKSDKGSLPVLLAALQAAGFSILDENRNVLLKPAEGSGQGLGFYDFEAVGSLKLANGGISTTLEKLTETIAKDVPQLSAPQLADLLLQDLRTQYENPTNDHLRFWARLIIELGKASPKPVDLMTALPGGRDLSVLQATLLTRRLQGDFYVLRKRLQQTGEVRKPLNFPFTFANFQGDSSSVYSPVSFAATRDLPCDLTGDEALMLDGAAILLTYANGKVMEKIGGVIKSTGGSAAFAKLGLGLTGANLALGWLKLVASLTMLRGEITVDNPPLIRTKNAVPGERRLMKARIWSEVGKVQMLNCVRAALNAVTGLDFNLPTDGPAADVSIEWHFAGENETNLKKFVVFESPQGADRNPQKQVTDGNGISRMYLVGAAKIPAVAYQKNPMKIEKKANVLVGVTLKSAKDFKQNWLDIGGIALGIATGGPLGLVGAIPEIGYRLPYVAARATIPVIDHEPCDGQWVGTVTYTAIHTTKTKIIHPPKPATHYAGGYETVDSTVTMSGNITVNSKFGHDSLTNSSADEITILDSFSSGKRLCSYYRGLEPWSARGTLTTYASGSAQGTSSVGIYLGPNYYEISIKSVWVKVIGQKDHIVIAKNCLGQSSPGSNNPYSYDYATGVSGRGSYGDDKNILSGSATKTEFNGTRVATITWNLKRCGQ